MECSAGQESPCEAAIETQCFISACIQDVGCTHSREAGPARDEATALRLRFARLGRPFLKGRAEES